MSVTNRKILPEVEEIFARYNHSKLGGRLKMEEALNMFVSEYDVSHSQSEALFRIFDQDRNMELSSWEFQKFYVLLNKDVFNVMNLYDRLSASNAGREVDIGQTFDTLLGMKTTSGRSLRDTEAERLLQCAAGSEKSIDLDKFINLMCMVKLLRD